MTEDLKKRVELALMRKDAPYDIIEGSWVDAKKSVPIMSAEEMQSVIKALTEQQENLTVAIKLSASMLEEVVKNSSEREAKLVAALERVKNYTIAQLATANQQGNLENQIRFERILTELGLMG